MQRLRSIRSLSLSFGLGKVRTEQPSAQHLNHFLCGAQILRWLTGTGKPELGEVRVGNRARNPDAGASCDAKQTELALVDLGTGLWEQEILRKARICSERALACAEGISTFLWPSFISNETAAVVYFIIYMGSERIQRGGLVG